MPGVRGDRGDDLDSDGPEPLATVGQLSSPRFASFFEPPLYTHERKSSSIELFQRRARYIAFFAPAPPPAMFTWVQDPIFLPHARYRMHCENGSRIPFIWDLCGADIAI